MRNSGATAVVEGVGDHGCEYMTKGVVAVLGPCGRNFAAGMSGGIAYVYDERGDFHEKSCNLASVDLEPMTAEEDVRILTALIEEHVRRTGSPQATRILADWASVLPNFVKVFPHELKRVLGVERTAMQYSATARDGAPWPWRCSVGKPTGFLEFERVLPTRRAPEERVKDWFEIYQEFPRASVQQQGARCMECGVPFCHTGCPVNNHIPDWNDLVYRGRWEEAVRRLHSTNNFPEFTGRICPAPCEASCVLGINQPPVTIKQIEKTIVERGWDEGWIHPEPAHEKSGKKVAVIGSGPAGLAAAQQLSRAGHAVTVFEKADRIGGLLRYGIPNFKLEKHFIDRRLAQMEAEGVKFVTNAHVGVNMDVAQLRSDFDAIVLAGGAEAPRDLNVPGRELKGIHFAMEFLPQQTKRVLGDTIPPELSILATGKKVVIIGGGDTGADCLGTSLRQGAASVRQFEIMPKPPETRSDADAVAAVAAATAHRGSARRRRHARVEPQHRSLRGRCRWKRRASARRASRAAAEVRADRRNRMRH